MKKLLGLLIFLIIIAICAAGGWFAYFLLEGQAPTLQVEPRPKVLGRSFHLEVQAQDTRSGLSTIAVSLIQKGKSFDLVPKVFPVEQWWRGSGIKDASASWDIKPLEIGLSQGNAILRISVTDSSFRQGLRGNSTVLEIPVEIDLTPPRIALKSLVHNIKVGGSGLVSYSLSEESVRSGVKIDDRFFPGYPDPRGDKGTYVALVAIPFDNPRPKLFAIEAEDKAGNTSRYFVPHRIFKRKKVSDVIRITDRFLERKMPDFQMRYPELTGDLITVFLQVNKKLRSENNARIRQICNKGSEQMLWRGAFKRLPHSAQRAGFADFRSYYYKGKKIDTAYHLGVDFASVAHAEVPAGNDGVVVFADYLGIYGNTVIIDHGLGLFSTYSHLSQILVNKGQQVKKGQIIGRTGTTGLAGGDHLHYGMLISGVFVNPIEWLDRKWIMDHIIANM